MDGMSLFKGGVEEDAPKIVLEQVKKAEKE